MEFKRYESSSYQEARDASAWGIPDPSLEDTVVGILKFMNRKGIISVAARELSTETARTEAALAEPLAFTDAESATAF